MAEHPTLLQSVLKVLLLPGWQPIVVQFETVTAPALSKSPSFPHCGVLESTDAASPRDKYSGLGKIGGSYAKHR